MTWLDDLLLASSSLDHEILIWDSQQLAQQQRLSGHSRGVASVSRLNDDLLVSGGFDNNLKVWDLPSGKLIRSLNNHTQSVRKLTVRPGEQRLPMVASISDDHTVRFWQPSIGRLVRFARLDATPTDCCWIRAGQTLAVACKDGQVRLVDPESAVVTNSIPVFQEWALSIALHPNGTCLAVGGRDGQLKIMELNELSAETE